MSSEVQIRHDGDSYETKSFTFPGGELQVLVTRLPDALAGDVTVLSRLQSSDALIQLLLVTEVLYRARRSGWRRLVIPYFPCARQDLRDSPETLFIFGDNNARTGHDDRQGPRGDEKQRRVVEFFAVPEGTKVTWGGTKE